MIIAEEEILALRSKTSTVFGMPQRINAAPGVNYALRNDMASLAVYKEKLVPQYRIPKGFYPITDEYI